MSEMSNQQSNISLSTFHSNVFDSDNKEYVVAVGYSEDKVFGYFICRESILHIDGSDILTYVYTNFCSFIPKIDETSYQTAISLLQDILY